MWTLPEHHHAGPDLLHARHRPAAVHRGVLAQADRLHHLHRRRGQRRLRRPPRPQPQRGHRSRQDARPHRRQAAALRHAHSDLLDLPPAARPLRHPDLGQHSALGLPAAHRPRAGHDRVPLVGQPARGGHPRRRARESSRPTIQNVFVGAVILWFAFRDARKPMGWEHNRYAEYWNEFHGGFVAVTLAVATLLTVYSFGCTSIGIGASSPSGRSRGWLLVLPMNIELVTIGTELLLGLTVDTNGAEIARALAALGVRVTRRTSVADRGDEIRDAVAEALGRTGAVLTTGGLGPTRDDITKKVVADLFGAPLEFDESVWAALLARFARLERKPAESNRSQAEVPRGATVLAQPLGHRAGALARGAARSRHHAARRAPRDAAAAGARGGAPTRRAADPVGDPLAAGADHRHSRVHPGRADGRHRSARSRRSPWPTFPVSRAWTFVSAPGAWPPTKPTAGCRGRGGAARSSRGARLRRGRQRPGGAGSRASPGPRGSTGGGRVVHRWPGRQPPDRDPGELGRIRRRRDLPTTMPSRRTCLASPTRCWRSTER